MKRFIFIAALCVPVGSLATTLDGNGELTSNTVEIRVAASELAECEKTLRELRQRPVVTDDGFKLPAFMRDDDLPSSVCVVEA